MRLIFHNRHEEFQNDDEFPDPPSARTLEKPLSSLAVLPVVVPGHPASQTEDGVPLPVSNLGTSAPTLLFLPRLGMSLAHLSLRLLPCPPSAPGPRVLNHGSPTPLTFYCSLQGKTPAQRVGPMDQIQSPGHPGSRRTRGNPGPVLRWNHQTPISH